MTYGIRVVFSPWAGAIDMAYRGYDPFNSLGSQDVTTLTGHTILLAASEIDDETFDLYLSDLPTGSETAFRSISLYDGNTLLCTLEASQAFLEDLGDVILDTDTYHYVHGYFWDWPDGIDPLDGVTQFVLVFNYFTAEETGIDINGLIQWPHLDLGALGREKSLIGLDLVATAPTGVSVSVGYSQRDLTARTAPYEVDQDTLNGQLVPIPVSGPSFDLQLAFAPGQLWEFSAANLYVQDWRTTA